MQLRDPFSRSSERRCRRNLTRTITASRPDTSPSDNGNLCRPCWKGTEILRENPRRDREIQWPARYLIVVDENINVVAWFAICLWNGHHRNDKCHRIISGYRSASQTRFYIKYFLILLISYNCYICATFLARLINLQLTTMKSTPSYKFKQEHPSFFFQVQNARKCTFALSSINKVQSIFTYTLGPRSRNHTDCTI